jgi:phosphoglycerol transferase MdoB-like AlkP superfamily enzyme
MIEDRRVMKIQPDKLDKNKLDKLVAVLNKFSLAFHGILSCLICFFAESVSRHSVVSAVTFIWNTPLTFLYNAMIIFITFLPVYFFKHRALVRVVISFIWCFLGVINGCVLAKRVTPFGFTDLKLINDLFAMKSTYFTPTMAVIAVVCVALFFAFCVYLYKKGPVFRGRMNRKLMVVVFASCYFWVPMVTQAAVKNEVLTDYFDNIAQCYERYGFVYGFSSSVVDRGMKKPNNYSETTVHEILQTISADTISENTISGNTISENTVAVVKANPNDASSPNIILVLLESFVDPTEINFLDLSEDPIPNFHQLEAEYSTGYLSVPVVGAGTANTEFEVLTGMSMRFFGTGEYPYKTVLKTTSCESIADALSDLGYGTYVIHNNKAKFYSRNTVFSQMGFDGFDSREFMDIHEYTPLETWPTDDILRGEVAKVLDDTPDQSDFVYTITVQGHGAYPTEKIIENPEISVSANGLDEEKNNEWEYYVSQIHEVDKFIGNLISDLEQRDEKTLVVMFGDHLPTMDLQNEDMASGDIFKTKYITWNNYGLSKEDEDVTAYQLMAHMLDQAGIHHGTMFSYHQSVDANLTSENDETYIDNMELLQYDLLYGERYTYQGQERYPASELEMGIDDAVISRAYIVGDNLIVRGENFTPWSKVYINGKAYKTKEASQWRLIVALSDETLEEGDEIVVNQCSGDTIFRSSNVVIY